MLGALVLCTCCGVRVGMHSPHFPPFHHWCPSPPCHPPWCQHILEVVEIVDQPSEEDVRAQAEMNLPWRLEYSWEDLIRVWRNTRTGEVIGPSLDSRVTPMTAKVAACVPSLLVNPLPPPLLHVVCPRFPPLLPVPPSAL